MRVIIAGGGTGGHLFPGVALAEELVRRGAARTDVVFVGTARGIEARVIPREGYPLELVDVGGLKGGGLGGVARGLLRLPRALLQSLAILRRVRPALVVGVGGYASGPVVATAALLGLPTAILEQNSVPGITNRILGRLARRVFVSFEEARPWFPAGKVELLGNPIRAGVRDALRAAAGPADAALHKGTAASQQNVAPGVAALHTGAPRTLLVLGGSQGATAVNRLVAAAVEAWAAAGAFAPGGALADLRVLHQSGATDAELLAARYRELGAPVAVSPFIEDMAAAYAAADLVIARAGATTLAELTAVGRPAILIPFPAAADDHQTVNARALVRQGAALLMPQAEATGPSLAAAAAGLLGDPAARARMAAAARANGRPDAARAIVEHLLTLTRPRSAR